MTRTSYLGSEHAQGIPAPLRWQEIAAALLWALLHCLPRWGVRRVEW